MGPSAAFVSHLAREARVVVGALHALATLATPVAGLAVPTRARIPLDGGPGGRRVTLDAYAPSPGLPQRGIALLVHGGAFTVGAPDMKPIRVVAGALGARGYGVLAVSYPLARGGVTIADQVAAVRVGISGARAVARELRWTDEPLVAAGFSAGATLLLLAAEGHDAPPEAIASVFGLYDFTRMDGPVGRRFRMRVLGSDALADAQAWSPRYRPGPAAPVTLLHGTADRLVDVTQAEALLEHRRAEGRPARLVRVARAPHAFFNAPRGRAGRAGLEALADALRGMPETML